MWTVIIAIVIGIVLAIVIEDFSALFLLAIIGIMTAATLPSEKIIEKTGEAKIACLQDNNSISGGFFLGCGSINGNMKYTFYTQENDSYILNQVNYDQVKIKYTNDNPRIEIYKEKESDHWKNQFSLCFPGVDNYIIYVPEGTIKQNYNLDAQ